MSYDALREECLAANLQLPGTGLVDLTFGNVSVADPEARVFAIKPSGVDYKVLKASDMVILDFDGKVVEGDLRPSSDTPTHRCLYLHFEGIRSVVHTHSRNAVAFAQAGVDLPCLGTTHCDYFHGAVPVTRDMTPEEVGGEYEWETGKVIVERFAELNPVDVPAVLVRNHGPFAWGPTGAKAVENALALEIVADMAIKTRSIRSDAPPAPDYLLNKHFFRKHGPGAYYGQK
ncbi:L-ribulose-5-phosphate 4-epimerase [Haloferula luteola]|uniref:L-ribulose-5-phosphate 4-epimerase n=1 Tax=Haloferula luteola TaxID=595692 RepID=A0A840VIH1_9BACT|nr:L-ribulose-5-phosphate 4-epimerase AraD [Haloferula luteola]MBB5353640.1 L-ribulose-5-phosphate 4-epimerase [Haloferula luteola]